MNLDALFKAYYFQYRTESDTPASSDDEYIIFVGLANESINRWSNYDNTYWKELFTSLQRSGTDGGGDLVLAANTTTYVAPDDMQEAGGYIRVYNDTGATLRRIPIIEPQDAQFKGDLSSYAYFLGDPNNGFTLNINPAPDNVLTGQSMDYIYYKKPTLLATGTDVSEMSEPYFMVHRALANRFRGSRNPYYQSAKNDAEDVLKTMQMTNNSGNWADPWKLADNSGGVWGRSINGGGGIG